MAAVVPHSARPSSSERSDSSMTGSRLLPIRAVQDSKVLAIERDVMLEVMRQIPEMSDIIVTVFAARRRAMLEFEGSSLTLIGADRDSAIQRVATFASRNRIPFRNMDLGDEETAKMVRSCAITPQHTRCDLWQGARHRGPLSAQGRRTRGDLHGLRAGCDL